ncbi:MAG: hypothetical protein IT374_22140 [Polyangiaceae bacterium]|nr:hypothetical protein [Polyangiaceae bacterium]
MRARSSWVWVALVCAALGTSTSDADAKRRPRVVWTDVSIRPERPDVPPVVKKILEKEGRRADWGRRREQPVEAKVEIRELSAVRDGDVVRVTCTAVGKIPGLGAAKSRFTYSGRPEEQRKLEHRVLELVARGIVTRLADIARAHDPGWRVGSAP